MKKIIAVSAFVLVLALFAIAFAACNTDLGGPSGTCTVTFELNYDGAPEAEKISVDSGNVAEAPEDPEREDYEFVGWYTDAACTTEADFEFAITEDVTYYAKWQQTVATVTFVLNNGTDDVETEKVAIGESIEQPEDPEYDDIHVLDAWYTDEALTAVYEFGSEITGDITLYAGWTEVDPDTVLTVTFMWNYDGAPDDGVARTSQVSFNSKPRTYKASRDGYYLAGWYTDAECTQEFDFDERLKSSVTLYARWMDIYTFEAEYVDFTGMSGNGYSGSMSGVGLIVKQKAENQNASNGHYAGWAYKKDYTLTFNIKSDAAVDDAVIVLRLSAEFYDMTYTDETYLVQVNGTNLEYDDISITGVPAQGTNEWKAFANFTISTSVSLKEGDNTIKLIVNNSDRLGDSGTMYATAPLVDCMYIYTDAGLSWTPLEDNLKGNIN